MNIQEKALRFAFDAHQGGVRKDASRSPYIVHPIGVVNILVAHGEQDPEVIAAGYLHDVIEDTATTWNELRKIFGAKVASIVGEVTNNPLLGSKGKVEDVLLRSASFSYGASVIKLADKIYNVNDAIHNPPIKSGKKWKERYISDATELVIAIAAKNDQLKKTKQESSIPIGSAHDVIDGLVGTFRKTAAGKPLESSFLVV